MIIKKLFRLSLLNVAVLLCMGAVNAHAQSTSSQMGAEPSRLLLIPKPGLPQEEFQKIVNEHRGKAKKVGQSSLYIVDLPANSSAKAVAAQLKKHRYLKVAEFDRLVAPGMVSNDPYASSQWHLNKIGMPAAWDNAQGAGVTIAILDSGVQPTHEDLSLSLVDGWNFYDNNSNAADVFGHGTKVAGVAAAITNNGRGVAGIAGQATIMPLRVSDTAGYAYWSTIAQGITYAADHGARVANASYAAYGSLSVQNAAKYMKDKDGLVFVSAGNTGGQDTTAATTNLIAVSATDVNDNKASWSSFGPYVSLSAPGAGIYTTTLGGGYSAPSGTSFASPMAAGLAAVLMSARPDLTSYDIESIMFATATDLGEAGRDSYYGHGRIDAAKAMQAVMAAPAPKDMVPPSISIKNLTNNSTVSGIVPIDMDASDNVGISKVELKVNGTVVAIDTTAPLGFAWDSTGAPNGMASIVLIAYDEAGNTGKSQEIMVNVANATTPPVVTDTTPPKLTITNPVTGQVAGKVTVSTEATDDSGNAAIKQTLYIDNKLVASGTGSIISYSWNTKKLAKGVHTVQAQAIDAAGNSATATVEVSIGKSSEQEDHGNKGRDKPHHKDKVNK